MCFTYPGAVLRLRLNLVQYKQYPDVFVVEDASLWERGGARFGATYGQTKPEPY
jgi:hypothetical protein